jgi:hypothetical protein
VEDRIRFIKHKGKVVLLVDCSHCSGDELEKMSILVPSYLTKQPKGSVLLLADFTGAKFDKKVTDHTKQVLVLDRPYLKRSAWVGIEALPKVVHENLKTFSQRDLTAFNTREEALEWLVSE